MIPQRWLQLAGGGMEPECGIAGDVSIAAELEEVVLRWFVSDWITPECSGSLVTCATMANFTGARRGTSWLLARAVGCFS